MEEREYSVSEAVRLIGVESHVLRYWEGELQVKVRRNAQGHRVYSEENIETFRCVRDLKEKGLQLKAIRLLMDGRELAFAGSGAEGAADEAEAVRGEVVAVGARADDRGRFEQILRRLIAEVVSEQNEKLKEELADLCLQYVLIEREAAACAEQPEGGWRKRAGRLFARLFGRKE